MSKEKMYVVKNDDGKYWDFSANSGFWSSKIAYPNTTIRKKQAEQVADERGGHVVTLIEEPKKVKLPEKAAEWIASIKNSGRDITFIFIDHEMPDEVLDWLEDDEAEHREERGFMLINAYRYGYTMEKEKKYNVKVPHAVNSYFKKIDANYCIAGDTFYVDLDENLAQFTESEIEQYGLQDCEKEEVTGYDEQ